MSMPIGGLELFVNRREVQYLDQVLVMFALREINMSLLQVTKSVADRAINLYSFMVMNATLKNTFRAVQEKGGGIWLTEQAVEHLLMSIQYAEPSEMTAELAIEHTLLANALTDRIAPQLTLIEPLVGRWEESPLTTKNNKWD